MFLYQKLQFVFLGNEFLPTFQYFHADFNTLNINICPNQHKRNDSPEGKHPNVLHSNQGALGSLI